VSDLYWPGDHRAGQVMSGAALVEAMVRVEEAWLAALVGESIAPADAAVTLSGLVGPADVEELAEQSESTGNPVPPLLTLLRARLGDSAAARWVHRGLTSQDVLDTALIICLRDAFQRVRFDLTAQVEALERLADSHRSTPMAGRTLTQHAVPITFGLKAAAWLDGVLDAAEGLDRAASELPVQVGGAAGTLAGAAELAAVTGLSDPPAAAQSLVSRTAATLGLSPHRPWHSIRAALTSRTDALVSCVDACGRMANDVLVLSRPEIAELAEPSTDGRGGSSTMPNKHNPVLSVLIRRAAMTAPGLGAQLHLGAAESVDERSDGAWHLEWAALRSLARLTVVAASQTTDLLRGLLVYPEQMRSNLDAALPGILAERDSLAGLVDGGEQVQDRDPATYLGATDLLIDAVLERAAGSGRRRR
jgi:3-carboxy-cis,cis-muconate cycloisomerase